MGQKVIWKKRALRQVQEIETYLTEEFGDQAVDNFLDQLKLKVERISRYPESGQATRISGIHRMRVNKFK